VILRRRGYGTGPSRDWAAKGTQLLGVKAVITRSFERIHRSNLVGMGVLPLQFPPATTAPTKPGIKGDEESRSSAWATFIRSRLMVEIRGPTGSTKQIQGQVAHRHRDRGRLLQARRHPALRAARADLEGGPAKG